MTAHPYRYTVFQGHHKLGSGSLSEMADVYRTAHASSLDTVLIFDDGTGRSIDFDLRLSAAQLQALENSAATQSAQSTDEEEEETESAGQTRRRGRPKLGVVSREVTLLPRHWEWLAAQPGGASVALRKLVESARVRLADRDAKRQAQERAYQFMLAMGGDLPGYEEASRALFADDQAALESHLAAWPADVREHALKLAALP